jgi:CHAT domain-containing protein
VVADGALQYIPFAALPIPSSDAPLASRHEIVSLPSASALAVLRRELRNRPRAPQALAIFADPVFSPDDKRLRQPGAGRTQPAPSPPATRGTGDREATVDLYRFHRLDFSRREADTIAALLPRDQVFEALDFEASRATVLGIDLTPFRNVHFATHGVVDSQRPDLSSLVLSLYDKRGRRQDDGFLRLNDIYNLRLGADLVVLSACRTALGKEVRGEGLIGLTRGFMYAGSARVLASLWSVEDRATAELMGSFYRGMLREGLSPAAALRKAQLEMARDPTRKSPYFWAGFSLQGEWR